MSNEVVVDLAFPITPGQVPIDHGYALYSSIARVMPELHGATWLGVHPLGGRKVTDAILLMTGGSAVTLRLPLAQLGRALGLVGSTLRIHDQSFELGAPTVRPLTPAPHLFSWQVALRLTKPPTRADGELDMDAFRLAFAAEAGRQLEALGISCPLTVMAKRVIRVKEQQIIGFSAELRDLSADQSLALQTRGLGGKRRMGCGLFRISRERDGAPSQ
jgi:CRISPR-associated protein Cas6